jgi:putative membrane protein
MGFGFVVARIGVFLRELAATQPGVQLQLPSQSPQSLWLGIGLVVLGVIVQGLALLEHQRQVRRYLEGEVIGARAWSLAAQAGIMLAALGVAIAVYLARYL